MRENLLFALLGWALATGGTMLVDRNRRLIRRREVKAGLRIELRDLRLRLICAAHNLAEYTGESNRDVHQQTLKMLQPHKGDETADRLMSNIPKLLEKATDEHLEILRAMKPRGDFAFMKKFPLPLLESDVGILLYFTTDTQRRLLDIRAQLGFYNERVDELQSLFPMTFRPDIRDENRVRLEQNIAGLHQDTRRQCITMIQKIDGVLPQLAR